MDCLTSRRLFQNVCCYKCQLQILHQRMSIFRSSRHVSQFHVMAGKNVKKKYPMCQMPIKLLKQEATPNSSLHNLKISLSKRCIKTSQRWIYVARLSATSYRANTAILNIRIFSKRYHFRLKVFASTGECISYWYWQVYYPVCYKVNDAKTFKNPYIILQYAC